MRVVYSYVKEHAEIVEKMKPPVDPVMNPLIDPRSVRCNSHFDDTLHYIIPVLDRAFHLLRNLTHSVSLILKPRRFFVLV